MLKQSQKPLIERYNWIILKNMSFLKIVHNAMKLKSQIPESMMSSLILQFLLLKINYLK